MLTKTGLELDAPSVGDIVTVTIKPPAHYKPGMKPPGEEQFWEHENPHNYRLGRLWNVLAVNGGSAVVCSMEPGYDGKIRRGARSGDRGGQALPVRKDQRLRRLRGRRVLGAARSSVDAQADRGGVEMKWHVGQRVYIVSRTGLMLSRTITEVRPREVRTDDGRRWTTSGGAWGQNSSWGRPERLWPSDDALDKAYFAQVRSDALARARAVICARVNELSHRDLVAVAAAAKVDIPEEPKRDGDD